MAPSMTLFARIGKTRFGLPFDRPVRVYRLKDGPPPPDADLIFDHSVDVGSFHIHPQGLRVVAEEMPPVPVVFPTNVRYEVAPGYELPIVQAPATVALGPWELIIQPGPFRPEYDVMLDVVRSEKLLPCALDKAALGGPQAILALASNPNLTEDNYRRWAQLAWMPSLRALGRNPSIPMELARQLAFVVPEAVAQNPNPEISKMRFGWPQSWTF